MTSRLQPLESNRLYNLRHSYVTLSLLAGAPPETVSEQAGHDSVEFIPDRCARLAGRAPRSGRQPQGLLFPALAHYSHTPLLNFP